MIKSVKLGDIARISSGGTPSRTNPSYWNGSIPWVKTTQIQNCVITKKDVDEWITEDGLKNSSAKMVPAGTIVLGMIGQGKTRGQVGYLDFDACTNQNAATITCSNDCNSWFIYQYLLFNYKNIRALSNSSGQGNLNLGLVEIIPVTLPPLSQQEKISAFLGTWDKAIDKTEALIAAKEKQFEWLISELISKPNEEKKDNWRQVKLGDIGEISSAGVDKKIIKGEIPVRLINYLDVYRSDFIDSKNITHQVSAPAAKASKCATQKGDIFFTPSSELRGDIGHSSVATEDMPDAVYSYHVVRLRLHENWDLKYRAYAFKARKFFEQAYKYADGSGQRYVISQNNFRKMEIFVPPLETQQKISNILSEAQKEISLLKNTLEKYRTQKRGLMQKLLTGEWQVSSAQTAAEGTLQERTKENVA